MAVRVISEAPVRTKQVTCQKCGYRLEYTGEDVKTGSYHDWTGDSHPYQYIVCPRTCSEKVEVKWP